MTDALRQRPPTRYAVEAAIAAVHAEALTLTDNDVEREFLVRRLVDVRSSFAALPPFAR